MKFALPSRRTIPALLALLLVLGALVGPAAARKGGKGPKMKGKAVVESFDAETLVLSAVTRKGETRTVTLSPEAKIGLIQHGKGENKSGFREGTVADIVPGLKIVMAKVRDGLVTKIIFSIPRSHECAPVEETPDGEGTPEGVGTPEGGDAPVESRGSSDCPDEGEDAPVEESPPAEEDPPTEP